MQQQTVKLIPPKFSGDKKAHPIQFLSALKNYTDVLHISDHDLKVIFSQSMDGAAKQWYYLIEHKVKYFDEFQVFFTERYWNEPIQQQQRIQLEKALYNKNLGKSRVTYAEELIAKELNLSLTEKDLINEIGRQFELGIARTVPLQAIAIYGNLFDLLQDWNNQDVIRDTKFKNHKSWKQKLPDNKEKKQYESFQQVNDSDYSRSSRSQ